MSLTGQKVTQGLSTRFGLSPTPPRDRGFDRERSLSLLSSLLEFAQVEECERGAELLLNEFGDVASALAADAPHLRHALCDLSDADVRIRRLTEFIQVAAIELARPSLQNRPILSNTADIVAFFRVSIGRLKYEQLRILHLDCDNIYIRDETLAEGTIDRAPLYPREVVRMALEANAAACILIHNHPGATAVPSDSDIDATKKLSVALHAVDIQLHDHIILSQTMHTSLRANGVI